MNPERKEILNLVSLPGRLNASETAFRLGFEPEHIPILVSAGQLKPLGNPPPGAVKFFLTVEIEQKKGDARWLNKATELVRLKIKDKNERAAKNRTLKISVSAPMAAPPMAVVPMPGIPESVAFRPRIRRRFETARSLEAKVTTINQPDGVSTRNHERISFKARG